MPEELKDLTQYTIPLRAYNITGIDHVRAMLTEDKYVQTNEKVRTEQFFTLGKIVNDLEKNNKKVIFTMGKGGVGKTTIAAAVATELSKKGKKVHLATTDPAAHHDSVLRETGGITMSHIDEEVELKKYQTEVLGMAKENHMSDKEIQRTKGEIPEAVKKLLPRLKSSETEVIIVTLPEATPVYEALRLEEDLKRADLAVNWWVINQSFSKTEISNLLLKTKASSEVEWINRVEQHTNGNFAVIAWSGETEKNL